MRRAVLPLSVALTSLAALAAMGADASGSGAKRRGAPAPELAHEWRSIAGKHWQIVAPPGEAPSVTDAREGNRGACAEGMIEIRGKMKVAANGDYLQQQVCKKWITRTFPRALRGVRSRQVARALEQAPDARHAFSHRSGSWAAYGRDSEEAKRELDSLWQGLPSGAQPKCRSPFGAYDMIGNVDEWTRATRPGRQSILKGGYWGPVRTRCRPTTRAHGETHVFYQEGVRCCADP